jgi:hypothetical protein
MTTASPRFDRSGGIAGRRTRWALALLLLLSVAVPTTLPTGTAHAQTLGVSLRNPAPGPLGAISVIGDSVLMGAGFYSPTLVDQLAANGWGPIRFQGVVGMSTGKFPVTTFARASYWVQSWRNEGWDAPTVIVNVGSNDQGLCNGSYTCARDSVLHLVNAVGPNRQIWWPLATAEPSRAARVGVWNSALRDVAAQRSNLHVWDWPHVMATEGFASHDNIHLSPDGYRRRSAMMAAEVTRVTARASRTGGDAPLPRPTAAPSTYVPLVPERIVDTRVDAPGRRPARSSFAVDFGGRLPPGTTAVAVNVTAAGPSAAGNLAARPCGTAGDGSTVNYTTNQSRGAMTITPVDARGRICVFTSSPTDVVVDLQGAFVNTGAGATFTPRQTPGRLLDTRRTSRAHRHTVAVPDGVDAVAVTLTAVQSPNHGHLRAAPCGSTTSVSNVNFGPREAVAGGAYVPVGPNGTICITTSTSVDVVVDLTGTFRNGAGGLSFVPVPPTRMLDTRRVDLDWSPIHGAGQTLDVRVAPAHAPAVTGTITLIRSVAPNHATAWNCGTRPGTSSVNGRPDVVLASSVSVATSATGRLCVYSNRATGTLFDTTGWWVPA